MTYEVWLTSQAEATLDATTRLEREQFGDVRRFLELAPYPSNDHDLIWASRRLGQPYFSFYNGNFPRIVRYEVDEYPTARMGVVLIYALDDFVLLGDPVELP